MNNIILSEPVPDQLITVIIEGRTYLITPNGTVEYSDLDRPLPLDELKIQLKYKAKKI